VTDESLPVCRDPILHDGFGDLRTFMDKFNAYNSIGAERNFREGKRTKFSPAKTLTKPCDRFIGRYIKYRGYKDSLHGFFMAAVIAFNYYLYEFKFYERLYRKQRRENWDDVYRQEAVGGDAVKNRRDRSRIMPV
jgi:hypothetical protein